MFKRLLPVLLSMSVPLLLAGPAPAEPIGLQRVEVSAINRNGTPDVQAGSHPYELVTNLVLSKPEVVEPLSEYVVPTGGGVRDVRAELPTGFVGNPNATPKCSYQAFAEKACPDDTAIGEATTFTTSYKAGAENQAFTNPVYNLEPPGGIAAEFAFLAAESTPIFLDSSVRTGDDYGVTVNTRVPEILQIYASKVKIWGVPEAAAHDSLRGKCLGLDLSRWSTEGEREAEDGGESKGECPVDVPVQPLLTNPTSCGVPRLATVNVDGWREPGVFAAKTTTLPELQGCEKLNFSPTLTVQPDGSAGSTPTGLNVGVHVSQESTTNPEGLGEADVKDTTVVLPPGVQISPSASDGLETCSGNLSDPPGTPGNEIGFTGFKELNPSTEPGVQTPQYTPRLPGSIPASEVGETEPLQPGKNFCPDASKIANVRVTTPLLEHEITGSVYLAAPQNFTGLPENPFSSLIAMYLVAEEPATGVLVKLPGKVSLNETTGQITTTFENTPQTPFSEFKLEFYGTDRAPLTTPALCGTYNTEASFVPWSGEPTAHPPASFEITSGPVLETASGPQTTPCSDPLPFSPTLDSGTTNINAGSFSELTTTLSREDGNQNIQSVTLHYPAGISGLLSGVKLCGEAQANAGTCGPESQIGESIVSVGLGNDPFTVVGGKAYITEKYEGAPFGLSIVNPAKAGPYVLQEGRPVVVRAKVEVNPITAALTVTTDPSGPYAIPHIIEGIPLNIKHVYVNINRHDFTFNPTNCTPTQVTGTINSDEGTSSPVSIPLQVTNCGDLKFKPDFKVSTSGKTSKADGASLTATVVEPNDPQGNSNIGRVKVDLPKQLPSRLTTLQKACTAAQFNTNPAGCPSASFIGHAVVHTQLLLVPLEGPAIFVSHGGEAFPSLEIVLQGDNVTIDLVGATYISPAGITSTTFKTVPDQPFETFELTLPEGKYSALAANGNLCTSKLAMPTEFLGQDGTKINESTPISVTGCAKVATLTRAQKLAKALKACHKDKNKGKRATCEKQARKQYGPVKKAKKKK